ncbi:MAG: hypothetical protein J1F07_03090 [Muribaculaceae bacterium]|nr:hypothetical protein [Muribaculaceae bacterium]
MKKIYSMLMATAVIAAASATAMAAPTGELRTFQPAERPVTLKQQTPVLANTQMKMRHNSIRKVEGSALDFNGNWNLVFGDFYFSDSAGTYIVVDYSVSNQGTTLIFEDQTYQYCAFLATYNKDDNSVSLKREFAFRANDMYIYQQPYVVNLETGKFTFINEMTGEYYPALGMVEFDSLNGLAWVAYKDEAGTVYYGNTLEGSYYDIQDFSEAYKPGANTNLDGTWTDLGEATLVDGWLTPGFDQDPMKPANQWMVPLQQNEENPGLYRLVNPYKVGPLAKYNKSTEDGYILFDASDPNHVLFLTARAGLYIPEMYIGTYYCYNQLGMYHGFFPDKTIDELIANSEQYGDYIPFTTFENGVVKLLAVNNPPADGLAYDATYGAQFAVWGGQYWFDEDTYEPLNMTAMIIFPNASGVDEVAVEKGNAGVEYFNLQGVKVANPKAGEIVIKREGDKVSKQIVR